MTQHKYGETNKNQSDIDETDMQELVGLTP
jgi:hypothetical protein